VKKKSFWKGFIVGGLVIGIILVGVKGVSGFSPDGINSKKVNEIEAYLDKYYVDKINKTDMSEMLYKGFVAGVGDPYTSYFTADELKSFMEDTEGSFFGIGVEILPTDDGLGAMVISPIEGSPAQKVGILPYDRIIKVDGEDVRSLDVGKLAKKIKGAEGTKVSVTVFREKTGESKEFSVERKIVDMKTVNGKMLDNDIGYLKLTGFKSNTYDQFMEKYQELKKAKMKGLIIDLRNNPGGLLDSVEQIGDELLPKGTMVYTIDKAGNRNNFESNETCIDVPVVCLVNGSTASAAEILAGAVQDMGVGKLVGTKTFGKGVVQGLFPLKDKSALKITIQKYYTPKGICIQGTGIKPDVEVELPEEFDQQILIPEEKDVQLKKAKEVVLGLK